MTVVDAVATEIDRASLTDWTARFLKAWNALDGQAVASCAPRTLCGATRQARNRLSVATGFASSWR